MLACPLATRQAGTSRPLNQPITSIPLYPVASAMLILCRWVLEKPVPDAKAAGNEGLSESNRQHRPASPHLPGSSSNLPASSSHPPGPSSNLPASSSHPPGPSSNLPASSSHPPGSSSNLPVSLSLPPLGSPLPGPYQPSPVGRPPDPLHPKHGLSGRGSEST